MTTTVGQHKAERKGHMFECSRFFKRHNIVNLDPRYPEKNSISAQSDYQFLKKNAQKIGKQF